MRRVDAAIIFEALSTACVSTTAYLRFLSLSLPSSLPRPPSSCLPIHGFIFVCCAFSWLLSIHSASLSIVHSIHNMAVWMIDAFASDALREKYVAPLCSMDVRIHLVLFLTLLSLLSSDARNPLYSA